MGKNFLFLWLLLLAKLCFAIDERDETMDQMQIRVNELTDQVEKLSHKNDVLTKKIETLSIDVEHRLKQIEKGNATEVSSVAKANNNVETKLADPKEAKGEYEKAYLLIKEQKYSLAEEAFTGFLQHFPNNEYSGPAYYWLGESFALRKRFDKAAINYIMSFNKFPKNNKADLSILKAANSLNHLNKKKEACELLAKLKAKKANLSPTLQKLLDKEQVKVSCK